MDSLVDRRRNIGDYLFLPSPRHLKSVCCGHLNQDGLTDLS